MNTATTLADHLQTESLIEGIADRGFAVVDDFLAAATVTRLAEEATQLKQAGALRRAGIGRNSGWRQDNSVRGDSIHWLQAEHASEAQQLYLQRMEALRVSLNRNLYLGLFETENHFAVYPAGASYRKHLDQFQGSTQRQLSCVLYLNQGWQPEHGGQLRLYLGDPAGSYRDITPVAGRFVAFLSGRFWHEVLPAQRERMSIAGWFRTRAEGSSA